MSVFRTAARALLQPGRNAQPLRATFAVQRRNFTSPAAKRSLEERISAGETVLCAEGYLLALSRRGYIPHGVWVPEFMLEQPDVLRSLSYEFVHSGTDVVEAFQYYTHREKMRQIGREQDLEKINRIALRIAREVAQETGKLFAGGICNTNIYFENDKESHAKIRAMYDEQLDWSKDEGVDYMIAETMSFLGEAKIALDVIKSYNLPAVITLTVHTRHADGTLRTLDGVPIGKACRELIDAGALVTGVNCSRGPELTLEVVKEIVKDCPPDRVCALPIAYRTTPQEPTFFSLTDKACPANNPVYPHGMDPFSVSPVEITQFTERCLEMGLKYLGICCGNSGDLTRAMAEAMGYTPPASRYHGHGNPGMSPEKLIKEGKIGKK